MREIMDFHWMDQWMGDVFLGILKAPKWIPALVEGREGGPNQFWSWRFVTATIYQVWDQQHVVKNVLPFLLKAIT